VHQARPYLLVAATTRREYLCGERLGVGTHDFPCTEMYLDRRQTGQIGVQQTQPRVLGIMAADIERDSAGGSTRIERLMPDTRVGAAGPLSMMLKVSREVGT
jgi:hypothetical protein